MRKLLLVLGAVALISIAGYVVAQTDKTQSGTETRATASQPVATASQSTATAASQPTATAASQPTATAASQPTATASQPDAGTRMRLAAMDTSASAFRKLDTDHDGRISPIEAAENPRIAAAFTLGDKDKDGYLSQEEFESLSSSATRLRDVDASSPSGDRVSEPGGDQPATGPNEPGSTATSPPPRATARPKQ